MIEGDDEDENYFDNEADLIPGDNSLPLPPEVPPHAPGAPPNLTRIPDQGGEIPVTTPVVG